MWAGAVIRGFVAKYLILKQFFLLITILNLLVDFGCTSKMSDTIEVREGDKYRFSNFISGIDKFPYEPPEPKAEKILKGFQNLALNMRQDEVLALLGEPDAEQLSYNKTKGGVFLDSSWGYYLHLHEPELANETHDKHIFIHFDRKGNLYWAEPTGIEGFKSLGSPLLRRD